MFACRVKSAGTMRLVAWSGSILQTAAKPDAIQQPPVRRATSGKIPKLRDPMIQLSRFIS
jgi:hypothetical protein